MQGSFGMSLGSKDEAVCLVDSVKSHDPKEDDARNVDIGIVRASNASEPSLDAIGVTSTRESSSAACAAALS